MGYLHRIGIENFKSFKEKAEFELAPITILTGTNNSGKSSIIRALQLFKTSIGSEGFPNLEKLKFADTPEVQGSYMSNVNGRNKNKKMHFSFAFPMNTIFEDTSIHFTYAADNNSLSNDGVIQKITIKLKNNKKIVELILNKSLFYDYYIDLAFFKKRLDKHYKEIIKLETNKNRQWDFTNPYDHLSDHYVYTKKFNEKNTIIPTSNVDHHFEFFNNIKEKYNPDYPLFRYLFLYEASSSNWKLKFPEMLNNTEVSDDIKSFNNDLSTIWAGVRELRRSVANEKGYKENSPEITKYLINLSKKFENHFFSYKANNFVNTNNKYTFLGTPSIKAIYDWVTSDYLCKLYVDMVNEAREEFGLKPYENYQVVRRYFDIFENIFQEKNYPENSKVFADYVSHCLETGFFKLAKSMRIMSSFKASSIEDARRLNYIYGKTQLDGIIRNYILQIASYQGPQKIAFVNEWISAFGLGSSFEIANKTQDGFVSLLIDGKPIEDMGYGTTRLIPIILKIACSALFIEIDLGDDERDYKEDRFDERIIILEEPETNLHPALQSKLADLLVDAAKKFNVQFIVETHSEYLIRKLQYLTAKKTIKPEDTAIYYFYQPEACSNDTKRVERINIRPDGITDEDFGPGFFDEALRLTMDLLKIQTQN